MEASFDIQAVSQNIENTNTTFNTDILDGNTDVIVNLINIADIINSPSSNIFSSNIVLIALEPFILNNLTIKGINQHVKITKDQLGNVFVNDKKVKLVEIVQGIKVLLIVRDETNEVKDINLDN